MEVTAFIAGATGYTGEALVEELTRLGMAVVAHVRPDSSRIEEWRERFGTLGAQADTTAWSGPAMRETLHRIQPDVVFSLLGTTRKRARAARKDGIAADYETVDYGLTVLLLRAVMESASDARFVYLSAAGVGPGARGEYLRVRWRVEQELRASGVPWTVARPGLITGPDRAEARPAERLAAAVVDNVLRVAAAAGAERLRDRWSSLTAAELARGLARHALDPAAAGQVIDTEQIRSSLPS